MSQGFYNDLAKVWQESKIDGLGYLNPQELAEDFMKQDSRTVESLAKKWNIEPLEREAHENTENPALGIARASVATGAGFAGAGAANALGSSGAYGAAVPGIEQGSQQAAMLAAQTGEFGGYGLGKTMQAASRAQGLSPMAQYAGNIGGGLMSGSQNAAKRYAFNQGMGMMNQDQSQPPPPPPPPPRQQQPMSPFGMSPYGMTEEQKMRLRMMGYQV